MMVTNAGRELFPIPQYKIRNLDESKMYILEPNNPTIKVIVEQIRSFRHQKDLKWKRASASSFPSGTVPEQNAQYAF
uniref:T-box domain-containing protein n=1 Tax=Caenorhabditis tropicalis TaxID=1561998 RepID=A0A1I7SZA0_9PELO